MTFTDLTCYLVKDLAIFGTSPYDIILTSIGCSKRRIGYSKRLTSVTDRHTRVIVILLSPCNIFRSLSRRHCRRRELRRRIEQQPVGGRYVCLPALPGTLSGRHRMRLHARRTATGARATRFQRFQLELRQRGSARPTRVSYCLTRHSNNNICYK